MLGPRITTRRLAHFCRRVGTSLEAGIDVRRVLSRECQRATWRERPALKRLEQRVAGGDSLDDALAATDGLFPPMVHGMVHVGEESGKLDQAFLKLAEHYERQLALRRTFLAGIVWPMIQLAAAVFIVGLLIWIMGMVSEMVGEDVDLLGLGLIGNQGLMIYVMIVVGTALAILILYRAAAVGMVWMRPVQRVILSVPVLGKALRTLALARMAWTLSLTLNTSMDTIRAVQLAVKNSQNVIFTSGMNRIAAVIRQGRSISEGLRAAGGYPQEFIDAIEVGEDTGQLSESMDHLSRLYEDRAKAALAALTVFAGFLVWGLVAVLIIAIIFRLALFYIGQINSVLNGI